jgi:hypothetical protein
MLRRCGHARSLQVKEHPQRERVVKRAVDVLSRV